MDIRSVIGLFLLGIFAFLILRFERALEEKRALVLSVILIAAAMLIRLLCMDYETLDYQNFLTLWVDFFRRNGGWHALSMSVGNYNVPYLYFLAAFSYSAVRDLYLIKLLSVFFDILLAWGVMRLVYLYRQNAGAVLGAFFAVLFMPTVILNGALWGQCDSIYAAFAVWSIYFALNRQGPLSVIAIAFAFAFKLQAVFLMPVFLLFVYTGRIKWYHLALFPVTYFIIVSPALLEGRPFMDTILLYLDQTGSIGGGLNYNSSSIFALLPSGLDASLYSKLGIGAAFLFMALVLAWLFGLRKKVSDKAALAACFVICLGIPFLLPHMHERYFFLADVVSLALAFAVPQLCFVPVCVSFASLLGYHAYLKMRYLLPMRYGAAALTLSVAAGLIYLACSLHSRSRRKKA